MAQFSPSLCILVILKIFFSGVVPEDLLGIVRILAFKGQFSVDEYNESLKNLRFSSYESSDKPYPIPVTKSRKITKLKGKAVSQWVHIRNWPLVIKNLVKNPEDDVIMLGLKLHELVERLTASEYYSYEIDLVEEKLVQYLELRKILQCQFPGLMPKPKPKHHFLRKDTNNHAFLLKNKMHHLYVKESSVLQSLNLKVQRNIKFG